MTTSFPTKGQPSQCLQQYRHIAVVGISTDQYRPSYYVSLYMQEAGYNIIPINPKYAGQTILGKHVYASLREAKEAGEQIEIVDIFRRSADTPPVAQQAIEVGAKVLWLQLGIRNDEVGQRVQQAGLTFIQDRCIKIEHALLADNIQTAE